MVEGARPRVLEFLVGRRSGIHFPPASTRMGCVAFEAQGPGEEACDLARVDWDWARSAPSAKGRSDFPWGFWLAWCAPSLAGEWGPALGARLGADALLAREVAGFAYDRDEWNDGESNAARSAAVLLERMELADAAMPARSAPRKAL